MSTGTAPRLDMEGIWVEFGPTVALADVSASIEPGQIVGLLGHNGAGKSTLFNVLAGAVRATAGSFRLDGQAVPAGVTPRDVAELGIVILHQEPALASNLTVIENLWLAQSAPRGPELRRRAREALNRVGAEIDLDIPVGGLSLGQRQLVGLARGLLAGEMKVLLLDEPTAALGKHETDSLHALIRRFADEGVAVVYVSHRLPDILSVCERILILSAGRLVADQPAVEFTPKLLARALAPQMVEAEFFAGEPGPVVLSVEQDETRLEFRSGEVVGLFGMAAGDQFTVLEELFGLAGASHAVLDDAPVVIDSARRARELGIHLVPADRERDGLISGLTARENVFLPWYGTGANRGWWIGTRNGAAEYRAARSDLDISGPPGTATIDQFSGGNRQKHLLARWMSVAEPRVLLLAQPTQGVDVGAKADIARAVRERARAGATVVIASAESDEIASMCDRSYVLLAGRRREIPRTQDFDEQLLAGLLQLADAGLRQKEGGLR